MNTTIRVTPEEMARQREYAQLFRALPRRPQTYHIVTYGCQMNAHDSEKLAGMLESMGMTYCDVKEEADFVLHNTCCVRNNAERKALGNVTWLKEIKAKHPGMLIGICGCMVQEEGIAEDILRKYPFIDIAFGTGTVHKLPENLYRVVTTARRNIAVSKEQNTIAEGVPILRSSPYQAYVTVMYGCNNFCSYCIVPYVRGRERSRTLKDVLTEVEGLQKQGVKEIMLLGQNVNSYGKDLEEHISFAQLLHEVGKTGIERIRFMTSHPKDLSDELIEEIAANKAVCRHFHLPVQSGSNRILEQMNRRYTREAYLEKVRRIRSAIPDIGLTTDIIVAFPGETEEDFEDTMQLTDEVGYDSAFTFIYSPREGTKAALMPDRIPDDIASERIQRLIKLQEEKTEQLFKSLVGTRNSVLITGNSKRDDHMFTGKSGRNISVNFENTEYAIGDIVPVRFTSYGKTTLRGEIIKE